MPTETPLAMLFPTETPIPTPEATIEPTPTPEPTPEVTIEPTPTSTKIVEEINEIYEEAIEEEKINDYFPIPQMSFIKIGSKIIPRNVRNSRRR